MSGSEQTLRPYDHLQSAVRSCARVLHRRDRPRCIVEADIKSVNTIVAALDLEAGSGAVLTRAIQLATAHAARLVLLHVIETELLSQAVSVPGRSENDLRNQLKRQALATVEPIFIESGRSRRTDVQVEFGSPHDVITRMAEARHADVIVVGPVRGDLSKRKSWALRRTG